MANAAIKLIICASYATAGAIAYNKSGQLGLSNRVKRIAVAAIVGIGASFAFSSVPAILFNAVILTLAWKGFPQPPGGPAGAAEPIPAAVPVEILGGGLGGEVPPPPERAPRDGGGAVFPPPPPRAWIPPDDGGDGMFPPIPRPIAEPQGGRFGGPLLHPGIALDYPRPPSPFPRRPEDGRAVPGAGALHRVGGGERRPAAPPYVAPGAGDLLYAYDIPPPPLPRRPAEDHVIPGLGAFHALDGHEVPRPPSPPQAATRAGAMPPLDFSAAARRGADHPPPLSPRGADVPVPPSARGRASRRRRARSGLARSPSPEILSARRSARGRGAEAALHLPPAAGGGAVPPLPPRRDPSPALPRRDHSAPPQADDRR